MDENAADNENKNGVKAEKQDSDSARKRKAVPAKVSYVNVNRAASGYKDKYRKDVELAIKAYAKEIGKQCTGEDFTDSEWKQFFKTNLIPLDKDSEVHMIDLFKDNRQELNKLLILHNTKAGENIAEVYFKRYIKDSPTRWYDLEDFKQMANEGLAIAAERFDPSKGNKFITFATWWMLNRVRKPTQERGAMENHISLNSPVVANDVTDNTTTLEEILSPESVAPDWKSPSDGESNEGGAEYLDRERTKANQNIYTAMKNLDGRAMESISKKSAKTMVEYLLSIVDRNKDSYNNQQIFMYLFKKVFNKCDPSRLGMTMESSNKLSNCIASAAKSKAELLRRLNMSNREYEIACRKLTRGNYDGI